MDSQKKYQIELLYGYQECEGDIYHAFDTKACGEQYDGSEIEEHLAQLLDTTPDDERFNWSSMQIALPAGVVKTIQLTDICPVSRQLIGRILSQRFVRTVKMRLSCAGTLMHAGLRRSVPCAANG